MSFVQSSPGLPVPSSSTPHRMGTPSMDLGQLRCPAGSFQLCLLPFPFQYKGANIQLLDLPGIIEGAAQGWLMFVFMCRRDLPSVVPLGVSDTHRFPGPRVPALSFQIFESLILCEARFLSLSPQKGLYVAQRWFSGGGSQSKPVTSHILA